MRIPFYLLTVATGVALFLPVATAAQSYATMPLSTRSADAAAEFRLGVTDALMSNPPSAARRFKAAITRDPGFGLARAFHVFFASDLARPQANADLDRAVRDAAAGTPTELVLATYARELFAGRSARAQALARVAKLMLPEEPAFANVDLSPATDPPARVARWRDITAKHPAYAPAWNALAYALWASADRQGALEAARKQLELAPHQPNAHDTYAELLQWNGDFDGAEVAYRRAIEIEPTFAEGYAGLAELAVLRGSTRIARTELTRALAKVPGAANQQALLRQLAAAYRLEDDTLQAFAQLEQAARVAAARDDTTAMALLAAQMAVVEAMRRQVAPAHALLARATTLRAKEQPVLYFTAVAHALLGHWDEVTATITKARAEPEAAIAAARNRLAAAEGGMLVRRRRPKEALAVLQQADTTDLPVLSWIAAANADLGDAAAANAQYQRIVSDRAVNLLDWAAVGARVRARTALGLRAATNR